MTTIWRAIVEGSWARSIVSAVAVPKARKVQEGEDLQQLYRCIRTMQLQKSGRSSSMAFQRLLLQVRSSAAAAVQMFVRHHATIHALIISKTQAI